MSFYTTELPQYMLTYTLLVLLAAFVAKGNARRRRPVARAAVAAVWVPKTYATRRYS